MQLKKIKRAEKKGTESVMDEKFALLFHTSVIVNDYRIRVSLIEFELGFLFLYYQLDVVIFAIR